jgi:electron transfer flavoprotein alpha subunit
LPNLLVPIDLRDGEPTGPSLFALGEGRRVAHAAGATVYAIVMSDRELGDGVVARLGRAGADKVLLCEGAALATTPLDATHGPALLAAVERISPLLVLFPAGGAGLALGPSLAARIGAAFAGAADVEVAEGGALAEGVGRVFLRRWRGERAAYRRLDPVEIERPVVAILRAGVAEKPVGDAEIDVEVIACAPPKELAITELASEPDPDAAVSLARVLVVVDPAYGPQAVEAIAAEAPPGVAVVDSGRTAALALSAPEIVVGVGDVDLSVMGTPRGRQGAIWLGSAAPSARTVDVLLRLAAAPGPELWREIGRALTAFAPPSPGEAPT